MFLVVTNERDITSDFVILELKRRGLPFYRLNTETLPRGRIELCLETTSVGAATSSWSYTADDGCAVEFSSVEAVYFRRPGQPITRSVGADDGEQDYCTAEWSAALSSALRSLGGRWLNSPDVIARVEDKPLQLQLALEIGLRIPKTLITNSFAAASDFVSTRPSVGKTLRTAVIGRGQNERVIFTTDVASLSEADKDSVEAAPVIYQQKLPKRYDVRVTVVGKRVFAASINSQKRHETATDWRKGSYVDLEHQRIDLPDDVSRMCVRLVAALGLRFGAIDLIQDQDGQYWFLECNPNGQWAWIETKTGLPISKAIVDELEDIANARH